MKSAAFAVRAAARREFAETADADLLRRFAAAKDQDAFAELVRRYSPLVWRVARTTAGPVAEDVFQATFLTLSKTASSVRDPAALAGWLHLTAYRTAVRARKTEAKRALPRPPAEPVTAADPLDQLTARELLTAVDEELVALPDAVRAAVVLCGVEGLSQDEAAARLGWTPGSVKGRLERGRAKLLARLAARGLALPAVLGGLIAVPAELAATTLESVRGAAVAPAVAALIAEGTGMTWSTVLKPAAVLAAVAALAVAATGGAGPVPAAAPQVVAVKPAAKSEEPPLVRWSSPLRTNLDDPSLPGGSTGVWTPDGKFVLVAGSARPKKDKPRVGEVRVHDAATGKVVHTFRGAATSYENRAGHLAVSPDGKYVAAGGQVTAGAERYYTVEVWEWGREQPKLTLGHHTSPFTGVAFAPDGKRVAGIDLIGGLKVYDFALDTLWGQGGRPSDSSWGIAFHPRGELAALGRDGGLGLWVPGRRPPDPGREVAVPVPGMKPLSVTFSPDGKSVALGGLTDADRVPISIADVTFDPTSGQTTVVNIRHGPTNYTDLGAVYQVAFSPDGKLLAAACQDKSVRVFDAATLKPLAIAVEHKDFVYSVQFSPDGKSLLTVGRDAVKVWSVAELMKRAPKPVDPKGEKEAALKRDRERLKGEWELRKWVVDGVEKDVKSFPANANAGLSGILGPAAQPLYKRLEDDSYIAVDATARPKTIEFTLATGPDKGKAVKAIYEFVSGDMYRVCWAPPGAERPTDFECKPGSKHVLYVLQRVVPRK